VSRLVLVLRPEPGAAATAARARQRGLEAVTAPLFSIRALSWQAPAAAGFDAVLLTSANAARHGGPQLAAFLDLPCHCVGEATAAAAGEAGFRNVRAGQGDGAGALAQIGAGRVLHLCGQDHLALGGNEVERRIVYAAEAVAELPGPAQEALARGALALVHSPRAGALFADLVASAGLKRETISIAAISAAAADAAGGGWHAVGIARGPRDEALLELAAELCQTERRVRE
jgi:uroporphyrinogen-III synthase